MARDIDVYQLVRAFANRNRLTKIPYRSFAEAVQRQARQADQTNPVFRDLGINPDTVLLPRLLLMAKEKRLSLEMSGNEIDRVVLPEHYTEVFLREYRRIDESTEVPFPDEESLGVVVPSEWIQAAALETDLGTVSDLEGEKPFPLYRLIFPESLKPIVVPSAFIPDKLLEYAVLKIRHYLRQGGNKEYVYNKLLYAFPTRDLILKEVFGAILTKPYEAIVELRKSSSDVTFPFWAYLVSHIKKDINKKNDKTTEDLAIYQAAILCEFYANHYKGKAQRLADVELAFKTLDQALHKPPYSFALEDICAFRDSKGQPLLGKYSEQELEERLKAKTTKAEAGLLPELLIISTGSGRRSYVAKDRLLLLALKLVGEARVELRTRLLEEWRLILADFRSIPAMNEDAAYRKELGKTLDERFPLLAALLADRLLPLVYEELNQKGDAPAELEQLFDKGEVASFDVLFGLPRKTLLNDARMLLPFWYSVPFLSFLARLFRRREQPAPSPKKAREPTSPAASAKVLSASSEAANASGRSAKERRAEFARAAAAVAKTLVPEGVGIDEYLRELEGRWNNLLNPVAKANLTEDVNSLVRDYLRGIIRTLRGDAVTPARIKSLAATLADSPTLLKIKNHGALELYVQVYLVKLLSA